MMRARRRSRRSSGGFVFVLLALALVVLFLVVGFAVDLGSWYLTASKLQRASDAAALSAASSLPDVDAARSEALASYERNGFKNGVDGIELSIETTPLGVTAAAHDTDVKTYFTSGLFKYLDITRTSFARRASLEPQMGSPFNVLGTGDLNIPGIPKQNFWLAMNPTCAPKEDGDYFSAAFDGNKGPFSATRDANNNYLSPDGEHKCPGGTPNPDFNGSGYSYYVDVPKAPGGGGSVDVMIYDPVFNSRTAGDPSDSSPDVQISLGGDITYLDAPFAWDIYDTNGTVDDESDDYSLLDHPYMTEIWDERAPVHQWWKLATIRSSDFPDGGTFRVQVFTNNDHDSKYRGINSFSIGAFPSWRPAMSGCDTRTDSGAEFCPRVYGRKAMSVYTKLDDAGSDGKAEFYFASVDPAFVGQSFDVMLWDPGEGVTKIEVLGPDDVPLTFNWTATPNDGAGYSGNNVTSIATNDFGPPAYGQSLSNPYKFNDRLITAKVTIPASYPKAVEETGSDYVRLRYTVASATGDRTTWGIGLTGGQTNSPRLTRSADSFGPADK